MAIVHEPARVLRERAATLARPAEAEPDRRGLTDVVVLSVGTERYGIEVSHVAEVLADRGITPVPGTPPFVLGVLHHRGRILTVLDLGRLLDVPTEEGAARRIVVVHAAGVTLGIAGETVTGPRAVAVAPAPATLAVDRGGAHVLGVTTDRVALLDLETLTVDPRIRVDDEAE